MELTKCVFFFIKTGHGCLVLLTFLIQLEISVFKARRRCTKLGEGVQS